MHLKSFISRRVITVDTEVVVIEIFRLSGWACRRNVWERQGLPWLGGRKPKDPRRYWTPI